MADVMADLKIDLAAKLPGESVIVAIINAIRDITVSNRERMSQANIDRLDAVSVEALENALKITTKFWRAVNLLE